MENEIEFDIVEVNEIDGGVEVFARVWKDGTQLGFGRDGTVDIERFRIFNPPVLVDDPDGDIVREWQEEDIETGEMVTKTRTLREDPVQAILESLSHTVSTMKNVHDSSRIVEGKRGNTTSTFYPETDPATNAGDGYSNKTATSWNAAHDATDGDNVSSSATVILVRSDRVGGSDWRMARGYANFYTTALGSDIIDGATLTLTLTGNGIDASNQERDVGLVEYLGTLPDAVLGDYDLIGDAVNNPTEGAPRIELRTPEQAGTKYTFTLNATGLSWVNGSGVTGLGLRDSLDITDTTPSNDGNGRVQFYAADQTGTADDPKLVVEHSAATSTQGLMAWF